MRSRAIVVAIRGGAMLLATASLPTAGLAAAPAAITASTPPSQTTGAALGWILFVLAAALLVLGIVRLRRTGSELLAV